MWGPRAQENLTHSPEDMSWSPVKKTESCWIAQGSQSNWLHGSYRGAGRLVYGAWPQLTMIDPSLEVCLRFDKEVYDIYNTCIFEQIIHDTDMYVHNTYTYLWLTYLYTHVCTTTRSINNKSKGTSSQHIFASFHFSRLTFRAIDPFKSR